MLLSITSLSWGNSWFTHKVPHTTISASASKELGIHLWYQSEAFIRLAPFDSRVSRDSKKFMIAAIEEVSPDYLSEKSSVKSNTCLCARSLEEFCTINFKKLVSGLCLLRLPEVMLSRGPALLEEDKAFREANGPTQRVGCHQPQSRLQEWPSFRTSMNS